MKNILVIELHHECGKLEYVEVDPEQPDAAERIAYCIKHNTGGVLKVQITNTTEL